MSYQQVNQGLFQLVTSYAWKWGVREPNEPRGSGGALIIEWEILPQQRFLALRIKTGISQELGVFVIMEG